MDHAWRLALTGKSRQRIYILKEITILFLVIILIGFIILGIVDLKLRKKYGIEKNEKFMDQYINRTHFIVEIWMYAMFLFLISVKDIVGIPLYFLLFIFFALIFSIRAMLEYVFRRETKRYIISLAYTAVGFVSAFLILFFG